MTLFCGLFRRKEKRDDGLTLELAGGCWEVTGMLRLPVLLRALGNLFSDNAVLYLEGVAMAPDVREFLAARVPVYTRPVKLSTVWPKPHTAHMGLTKAHLAGLAALSERHAEPEVCDHLHVYEDDRMLLCGFDVPDGHALLLSLRISEEQVKAFATAIGCQYAKGRN